MLKRFLQKLSILYKYCVSPETYARKIGVTIGTGCFISTREWSSEPYLVTIGNNVQITRGVAIHTHGGANAVRHLVNDFDIFGKVIIEDGAYIGAHSQIMPGIRIGKNAIVAAGSIVTRSVPDNCIVGGAPAQYICSLSEFVSRNEKFNTHTYGMSAYEKKRILSNLSDSKFIHKPYLNIPVTKQM